MCASVQERHEDLEETVAETDPGAGAIRPTYRNADRGSKTDPRLYFACSKH